jgi:hypothetical protein
VRRCRSADLPFVSLPDDQGMIGHPDLHTLCMTVSPSGSISFAGTANCRIGAKRSPVPSGLQALLTALNAPELPTNGPDIII